MSDYELQALLELRENARDEAERDLGEVVAAREQARQRLDAAKGALAEHEQEMKQRQAEHDAHLEKGIDLVRIRSFDDYCRAKASERDTMLDAIEAARSVLARKVREVEDARELLIDAQKELKAVEKHRESWLGEKQVHEKRRQDNALDEMALATWKKENR